MASQKTYLPPMLGKLKNLISHAVTSLASQRPNPPNDPQLENKLKFLLDYIFRHPTEEQFKAYHSLQSPQLTLNEQLKQIYHSPQATSDQISSILHFFTFLLLNCNNQLVLCKVVSDSFVLQLSQVHLNCLHPSVENNNVEIEEINSYKIALIKAYVSKIDQQTIKYMILNDRMRIFENCVTLYEQYLAVQEEEQFGVESTCISNCILLITRFLAAHPTTSLNICNPQAQKGLVYLLVKKVQHIHQLMLSILNSPAENSFQFQLLKDKILFLIDIFNSIPEQDTKNQIIDVTSKELTDLRQLFKEIVMQHTVVLQQNQQNYINNLELVKVLLKLLAIYYKAEALLPAFEECLIPFLNKFIKVFRSCCSNIYQQSTKVIQSQQISQKQLQTLLSHKVKTVLIFCSNMQILASTISAGQYLSRRNQIQPHQQQFKTVLINYLIDTLQLVLSEQGQPIQELLCYKSIKCLLLSLMNLTVSNQLTMHEYSTVKFHQFAINNLKKHLKKAQLWDYVVLNYQSMLKAVSHNLLLVEQNQPMEYAFCQFHDHNKHKQPQHLDGLINAILINQCSRNLRFMIVEKTNVSVKDIKIQKNYHNNFISKGWNLEPGTEVPQQMQQICQLIHTIKGLKIFISVIQDDQCLLFSHTDSDTLVKKIIVNIRFKNIECFYVEKELVHIKLKGLQEILVEAGSKGHKHNLNIFKQYLTNRRDFTRQKQLKFIHHYLDIYYQDNIHLIHAMGEADIDSSPLLKPKSANSISQGKMEENEGEKAEDRNGDNMQEFKQEEENQQKEAEEREEKGQQDIKQSGDGGQGQAQGQMQAQGEGKCEGVAEGVDRV